MTSDVEGPPPSPAMRHSGADPEPGLSAAPGGEPVAQPGGDPEVAEGPEGGDPACWVHLVCPVCGTVGPHAPGCSLAAGTAEAWM
jgi:hypothetical protein